MATLTVLGIGNILMRDEGIGVRLMEAVRDARDWPSDVEFIDGGAGGLSLLNVIESAERLVVFDAAEMQLVPGECRTFSPEDLAADRPGGRITMHDVSFLEALELCERFSRRPPTVIFAIEPKTVEFGRQLSDELSSAFDRLVEAAVTCVIQARGSFHGVRQ